MRLVLLYDRFSERQGGKDEQTDADDGTGDRGVFCGMRCNTRAHPAQKRRI